MNICVVGLGSMGKRRIRLLKKMIPDAMIIGVDNNFNRVETVANEYGIQTYLSLKNMKNLIDCVFVCTSPQSHGIIINEYLQRNCHVFSEINLINKLYYENMQLAKEKKKVLFLSSTPLYKEEIQFVDKRVKENGKPCTYQYHVGQYLPDWHPWDKLKDFFVSNKETNGCREFLAIELPWIQNTFGKITKVHSTKKKLTSLALEFPDTYLIQIEHKNGTIGQLLIDVVSRQAVRMLEVLNEDLYIKWNGTPNSLYEKDIISGELKQVKVGNYIHEQGYAAVINEYAYEKEIEEFFEVIKGKQAVYDFEKDITTLEIIDEIEE